MSDWRSRAKPAPSLLERFAANPNALDEDLPESRSAELYKRAIVGLLDDGSMPKPGSKEYASGEVRSTFDALDVLPVEKLMTGGGLIAKAGAAGLAPFFMGGLKDVSKGVAKKAVGKSAVKEAALDMSEAARMARAKKMGFDTGKTWYHGTGSEIESFDPSLLGTNTTGPSKRLGVHLASDPALANEYAKEVVPVAHKRLIANSETVLERAIATGKELRSKFGKDESLWPKEAIDRKNGMIADLLEANDKIERSSRKIQMGDPNQGANVIPANLKLKNPYVLDLEGGMIDSEAYALAQRAKESGKYDGIIFKNAFDTPGPFQAGRELPKPSDVAIVFDPSQIRSKFAAFDPKKAKSGNLSAALAGVALGGGALAAGSNQAEAGERGLLSMAGSSNKTSNWRSRAEPVTSSWRDRAVPAEEETSELPTSQAALEGFGQGAAMGYLPQLQALAGGLVPDPNAKINAQLKEQGFNIIEPEDTYLSRRDENLKRQERLQKESPIASRAGQLGGVIASAPAIGGAVAKLPLLGASKGAGLLSKVGKAAGGGAAMGLLQNPGDTLGELSPVQAEERVANAKTGAVVGGAITGVFGAITLAPKAVRKVASALTAVPEKEIETYAKSTQQVNKLIKDSGGEVSEAADLVRTKLQDKIRNKRQLLSKTISDALSTASKDAVADITPIVSSLEKVKAKLNPRIDASSIAEIDDLISKVLGEAKGADVIQNKMGKLSVQSLNRIKQYLQEQASPTYFKGGQIFSLGKDAQRAAKYAAAEARKSLNLLSPEIRDANNRLALLHEYENQLNKNLLSPGKPEAALIAAGSGANSRNAKMLKKLGEFAGVDALGEAEKLAAAKRFGKANLLPEDVTGKAAARLMAAGGGGLLFGGPLGALAGSALTSPATLKGLINLQNKVSGLLPKTEIMKGLLSRPQTVGVASAGLANRNDKKKGKK